MPCVRLRGQLLLELTSRPLTPSPTLADLPSARPSESWRELYAPRAVQSEERRFGWTIPGAARRASLQPVAENDAHGAEAPLEVLHNLLVSYFPRVLVC